MSEFIFRKIELATSDKPNVTIQFNCRLIQPNLGFLLFSGTEGCRSTPIETGDSGVVPFFF